MAAGENNNPHANPPTATDRSSRHLEFLPISGKYSDAMPPQSPARNPPPRPSFLGGDQNRRRKDGTFLLDEEDCQVYQAGDAIEMVLTKPWSPRHAKLAAQHKVNSVQLTEYVLGKQKSVHFLLDLPPLRHLGLHSSTPRDLSAVTKLAALESLSISFEPREPDAGRVIDFSPLAKLKKARVWIRPELMGILQCSGLESLWISNAEDMNLRALDFSRLGRLRMLHVQQCPKLTNLDLSPLAKLWDLSMLAIPKLKNVALHPEAKVTALNISGLGAWRIDWDRMGDELEILQLWGPLKWPLADILKAPNLKELHTNAIRQFPPLGFLSKMTLLHTVSIFTTPPGPKLTKEDDAVLNQINARRNA